MRYHPLNIPSQPYILTSCSYETLASLSRSLQGLIMKNHKAIPLKYKKTNPKDEIKGTSEKYY